MKFQFRFIIGVLCLASGCPQAGVALTRSLPFNYYGAGDQQVFELQ